MISDQWPRGTNRASKSQARQTSHCTWNLRRLLRRIPELLLIYFLTAPLLAGGLLLLRQALLGERAWDAQAWPKSPVFQRGRY